MIAVLLKFLLILIVCHGSYGDGNLQKKSSGEFQQSDLKRFSCGSHFRNPHKLIGDHHFLKRCKSCHESRWNQQGSSVGGTSNISVSDGIVDQNDVLGKSVTIKVHIKNMYKAGGEFQFRICLKLSTLPVEWWCPEKYVLDNIKSDMSIWVVPQNDAIETYELKYRLPENIDLEYKEYLLQWSYIIFNSNSRLYQCDKYARFGEPLGSKKHKCGYKYQEYRSCSDLVIKSRGDDLTSSLTEQSSSLNSTGEFSTTSQSTSVPIL